MNRLKPTWRCYCVFSSIKDTEMKFCCSVFSLHNRNSLFLNCFVTNLDKNTIKIVWWQSKAHRTFFEELRESTLLLTEEILSITAGSDRGSYAKPLLCKCYPLTRGCSRRKSLFLNFAENAMQRWLQPLVSCIA